MPLLEIILFGSLVLSALLVRNFEHNPQTGYKNENYQD